MASVFDVAKYFLERLGPLCSLKLQKLCYYSQAYHLAWTDKEIFPEEFEAWKYGPVCLKLRTLPKNDDAEIETVEGDLGFNDTELATLEKVLKNYGNRTPMWLSELSHSEKPWKNVYEPMKNNLIEKQVMKAYYKQF